MGESYSGIRALADFIRDVAKYQQAFLRRCRGTVATLSTDSVVLVSSFFFFFDSTSTHVTHGAAILLQLSSPKSEFYEPAPSADPILSTSYELNSGYIAFVQENSFSGRDCENPYHHLCEFEQVCSCKKISGMTHETLKWKLFPFSLSGEAKQWYIRVVGCVNGNWIELWDRFCSAFFLLSRICALRMEILTFRQNDKESIGVAWARFILLEKSGPDLSLPEHLLL